MTDQYIIPLFVAGSLLLALFAFFLVAYLLVQKRKQNAYQAEKQHMVFEHEKNILRTQLEEKENTMKQISEELHDHVIAKLGYAHMKIHQLAAIATGQEQESLINNAGDILETTIDDVRSISHSMNGNFVMRAGLAEMLTTDLETISLTRKINCDLEIRGNVFSLGSEKELHICRIAQESVQNCLKHANATDIKIILTYEPNSFTMRITDNGAGFDKSRVYEMKGLGFLNMFQRARYVHGILDVQSAPGQGSTITLSINLE